MNAGTATEVMQEAAQAHQAGRLEEAESLYRQALELKPDYASARFGLGMMLAQQNRLEEAAECYREILKDWADRAEVHHALGNVYDRLGRLHEALTHFEKAVVLKPGLVIAHISLG